MSTNRGWGWEISVKRLVIVAPNWLGDAVMALPAIADVRRAAPDCSITVAARPSIAPLFGMVDDVNDVITLEPGRPPRRVAWWRDFGAELRSLRFEAALILPNSFQAALVAAGAGIPERWGYRTQWRDLLLTRGIDRAPVGTHQVDYYQQLVHALGFPNGPVRPRLDASADIRELGAQVLSEAGWDRRTPLVALAPGAAYGGAKRWPAASFAELARTLAGDGVSAVIVGSTADAATGEEMATALAGRTSVLNVIGRTDLRALAGVLVHCRGLVANDSGAMHLGAALGVSVIAVFGPTDERVTGPRAEVASTPAILTHPVWCRPCLLRECALDHRCMRGIGVDAVAHAARLAL